MISLTDHVQLSELVWTLVALVGVFYAWQNLSTAKGEQNALLQAGINSARKQWAAFSVFLHRALVGIGLTFALAGMVGMLRVQPPEVQTTRQAVLQLTILVAILAAEGALSLLSYRWREVDNILRATLDDAGTADERDVDQNAREVKQDARTEAQDAVGLDQRGRSLDQNVREAGQNVREDEQNVREVGQNTRDKDTP